jgi:hypothetical protein
MSKAKRRRTPAAADSPPPELILAAVDRARRHRMAGHAGAPVWAILEHLAIPRRGASARAAQTALAKLRSDGMLETTREHGVELWVLAPAVRARLADAAAALPESPQHAEWRSARAAAAQEIERFRATLAQRLEEARASLVATPKADSDAWLALGESLQRDCWLLASATHCLYEWAEPDDAVADLGESQESGPAVDVAALARRRSRRAGLRNIRLWRERHERSE